MTMLRRNSIITKIAETIVKVHEKMIRDDSGLQILMKQRDDAKRAADNIIKAIEQGIIMDLTKDRLMDLQNQIDRYEIKINQAMQKTYAHLTVEEVEKFLLSKVFEDSDDVKVRKLLMNTFLREVIWYGDRLVITYNFQEDIVPEKLTKSHVEQVEKEIEEVENASSSFALGSYKFSFGAPNAFPSGKALLLQKTKSPCRPQADSGGGVAQPPSTAQRAQALPFPAPRKEAF